jgi:hypothetical protein
MWSNYSFDSIGRVEYFLNKFDHVITNVSIVRDNESFVVFFRVPNEEIMYYVKSNPV